MMVSDVGKHGVHVSDCDLAVCGAGGGDGSPASGPSIPHSSTWAPMVSNWTKAMTVM
jgi:hypothetical protein